MQLGENDCGIRIGYSNVVLWYCVIGIMVLWMVLVLVIKESLAGANNC